MGNICLLLNGQSRLQKPFDKERVGVLEIRLSILISLDRATREDHGKLTEHLYRLSHSSCEERT